MSDCAHDEGTVSIADIDRMADEIAAIAVQADATTHRLLAAIRRFDASGGWGVQGASTCAHWLSWRIGLDPGAAREQVRVARALGDLPRVDAALARGEISYSKARAITRVATPENEATLLHFARSSAGWQLERICRSFRRALASSVESGESAEEAEQAEARRWVRAREQGDGDAERGVGMVRVEAVLRAEEAAVVMRAIDAVRAREWRQRRRGAGARARDVSAEAPLPSRAISRADALVALAEAVLASGGAVPGEGHTRRGSPIELMVHVSAETSALEDGTPLGRETVERLCCDATVVAVAGPATVAASAPPRASPTGGTTGSNAGPGSRVRTLPGHLRRALRARDGGCRFPGCSNSWTDGHHIEPWSRGGPTVLGNLISLCRRHHRFVHERGYTLELARDGSGAVKFRQPDGIEVVDAPEPPSMARVPDALRALDLADPRQTVPDWDGERVDYGMAVEVLLARTAATR